MSIRRRYLLTLFSMALVISAGWYLFLYPQEPWIKYNFVVRSDEINAVADYLEGQSDFREFSCIADDVFLDKKAAPVQIHKVLQNHCRTSRIHMGNQTETGSFYYLGWSTKWFNDYWIAVLRESDLDNAEQCSRWSKPEPLAACIVRLSDDWAIHYFNATAAGEKTQELAEEVAEHLSTK